MSHGVLFDKRSYKDIIGDPDEVISIEKMVWLLKSVSPKLTNLIERRNIQYKQRYNQFQNLVQEIHGTDRSDVNSLNPYFQTLLQKFNSQALYSQVWDKAVTSSLFFDEIAGFIEQDVKTDRMKSLERFFKSRELTVHVLTSLEDADRILADADHLFDTFLSDLNRTSTIARNVFDRYLDPEEHTSFSPQELNSTSHGLLEIRYNKK